MLVEQGFHPRKRETIVVKFSPREILPILGKAQVLTALENRGVIEKIEQQRSELERNPNDVLCDCAARTVAER